MPAFYSLSPSPVKFISTRVYAGSIDMKVLAFLTFDKCLKIDVDFLMRSLSFIVLYFSVKIIAEMIEFKVTGVS